MSQVLISVSGTKEQARSQIVTQVQNVSLMKSLCELVKHSPGTHVSLSGELNSAADRSHGSLQLSGSFWTPRK